ncbi:MAG: hypothetical protein M3O46_00810, partial [Myxococcota bacterium]|nr:hypothetical protein [Myxococcota bacterium]
MLCVAMAIVGIVPFATALVIRAPWARAWATRESEQALRAQGIVATYDMTLRVWPLALELAHVRVDSTDGGAHAVECEHARVRPKLFALLAGKIAIDQVELDGPILRVVVRDGAIINLPFKQSAAGGPPSRAPFSSFAVTDASIDVDMETARVRSHSLDLDVAAEDDPAGGTTFEIALRVGNATVQRLRPKDDGSLASDDDTFCSIDARVSVQPDGVLVRRLDAAGYADLDAAPETTPTCDLPTEDKRRIELSLGHLHVVFPKGQDRWPAVDGHVALRGPIALAGRSANLPDTDGWIRVDADVHYAKDNILPEVAGTLEAHDVRMGRYAIAQELHSDLTVGRNVVRSPRTTVRLANGTVTLTDTVIDPFAGGGRLEKTRLDASGVDFTALLRALGVHPMAHVAWDIREAHAPLIAGTFAPLKLDGDFTLKTGSFGVYDRSAEDHARERLFGFSESQVSGHLGVRSDAIKFYDVHAALPHSRLDGGSVSLGFADDLRIDAPAISIDFDDVSPIGPVMMHGKLEASGHVGGMFDRPEPEGDIKAISALAVADVAFGDVSAGHLKVDVEKPEVAITNVRAKRRDSFYEVPTANLKFGGTHGFVVDAVGSSGALGLRDLLSMFALDEDPRFDNLDAAIATRADVHVALGGPEDKCGSGYLGLDAKAHLTRVLAYGERFAQGDADVSLHWFDRQQGIAGASIDVRSFVLAKIQPPTGTRAGATGTLLGSASLRRGGALSANIMAEGVPLSRVDALGAFAHELEGSVSGVAHVTGELDDFRADAGMVARAALDVAGTRVSGVALPGSHLEVRMTHRLAQEKHPIGHTRCGASVGPPFNKVAYLADTSSHGEWTIDGDLLGGTARLRDVVMTRAKSSTVSGRASLRGFDLGALAQIAAGGPVYADESNGPSLPPWGGQLWGELIAEDLPLDHPSDAHVRFFLGPTVVSRGGQKLTLQPPRDPLTLADNTLTTPPLQVTLDTPDGFRGGFVLKGSVSKATTDPTLAFDAELNPVDLAVLQRVVPKV